VAARVVDGYDYRSDRGRLTRHWDRCAANWLSPDLRSASDRSACCAGLTRLTPSDLEITVAQPVWGRPRASN
jgi:hypothetical protein